jgi:RarD protein
MKKTWVVLSAEPHLLVLLTALLWGFIPVIFRFLGEMSSELIVFYRLFFAAFSLFLAVVWLKKDFINPVSKKRLIALGALNAVTVFAYVQAVKLGSVSTAIVLQYTAPAIGAVLAMVFLKESLSFKKILSLALAFSGVALIALSQGGFSLDSSFSYGLLSGLSYGVSILIARKVGKTSEEPMIAGLWQVAIGAILFAPNALSHQLPGIFDLLMLFSLGSLCMALPLFLVYNAVKKLSAATLGSLLYAEVLFATLLAWLFLGEVPSAATVAGGILVLGGTVIAAREK